MNRKIFLITFLLCVSRLGLLISSGSCNTILLSEREVGVFLKKNLKNNFRLERTLESFSSNNFIVQEPLTGDKWVLRMPHEVSNLLSDRIQEMQVLEWARREQISLLEVKACDPEKGYLLTRFLSGQASSISDFQDEETLQRALKLLYRLHSSKTAPISTRFNPLTRFLMTSDVAANRGVCLPREVRELAGQLRQFLLQIPASRFLRIPCHNDPSPENFFIQEGSLYLHDWELAGLNDPTWDLAHLSVIAQIAPEKILNLYRASDPLALEKMVFFKPFIFFNTLVWASLERQQRFSFLSTQIIEDLYQSFLEKIINSIKDNAFQSSLEHLTLEGKL